MSLRSKIDAMREAIANAQPPTWREWQKMSEADRVAYITARQELMQEAQTQAAPMDAGVIPQAMARAAQESAEAQLAARTE